MSDPSTFFELSTLPKWIVDDLVRENGTVIAYGWALPENPDKSTILLNGRLPINFDWLPSKGLSDIFPYLEQANFGAFRALYNDDDPSGDLHFSLVRKLTHAPYSRWGDIYFPSPGLDVKIPEPERMRRTQGNASNIWYRMYGYTTAVKLDSVLRTYFGRSISDYSSIVDWGVGCGRVAQYVNKLAPKSALVGLDIDADNIEWCARNLVGDYLTNPLMPPTSLSARSCDLLYGISVFTHLALDPFKAWISELARILRPGAPLLVTLNGTAGLIRQASQNEELIGRVLRTGFDDGTSDIALEGKIADSNYYRATYILPSKVHELFGGDFIIRDILLQSNAASQDLIVGERR